MHFPITAFLHGNLGKMSATSFYSLFVLIEFFQGFSRLER